MHKQTIIILTVCVLLTLVLVMGALANSAEIHLPWTVIAGGGGVAQSDDLHFQGSIGQAVTGSAHGSTIKLGNGYWTGIVRVVPPPRKSDVYLPIVKSPAKLIASSTQQGWID